jgi:nicotinamide riboside transporter PnuC
VYADAYFLEVIWISVSLYDAKYISVVVCFLAFLANDIYGYYSWQKMKQRQSKGVDDVVRGEKCGIIE